MSSYLVKHDGLFLGSNSLYNLVACVNFKLVRQMGCHHFIGIHNTWRIRAPADPTLR